MPRLVRSFTLRGSLEGLEVFSSSCSADSKQDSAPVRSSSVQAGIQWLWAKRWNLSFNWQYRNLTANGDENPGFGGSAFLKTVWTSQNVNLSLKYTY